MPVFWEAPADEEGLSLVESEEEDEEIHDLRPKGSPKGHTQLLSNY